MMENSRPVINESEFPKRWSKVFALMDAEGLDLLIAYSDDRATFGAAHARWLGDFPTHFEPALVMFAKGSDAPVLLVGPETLGYAQVKSRIRDIRVLREFTHPDEDYPFFTPQSLTAVIVDMVQLSGVKRVGIAAQELMGAGVYTALRTVLGSAEWVDVEHKLSMLRAVKTPAEIGVIKYCYKIAEAGFFAAMHSVAPGVTEREVAAAAESAMRTMGAEGTGIDTIVASGVENTRPILARTSFRHIMNGDTVVITVAPRYEGYHGAIARPIHVGRPEPRMAAAAEAAEKAQKAVYAALKAGIKGSEAEETGRRVMREAGLGQNFLYSGIHSVGVIEFEPPIFGPTSETVLENGMVVSVDIPVFNAPFGGLRVEDGYLIESVSAAKLNHTPYNIKK